MNWKAPCPKRSHFVVVCYSGQLLPDLQKFLRSKKAVVLDTRLGATNRHRHSVCNLWSSRTKMDFGYRFEFELWLQEALSVCSWVGKCIFGVAVSSPLTEDGVTPPAVGLWPWAETLSSTGLRRAACHVCRASLGLPLLLITDSLLQFTDPDFQSCF